MPTYKFKNNTTGEEFTDFMNMSQLDIYMTENSHLTQLVNGAPMIVSGVPRKPDDGFRDVLRDIKRKNSKGLTRSTINTF